MKKRHPAIARLLTVARGLDIQSQLIYQEQEHFYFKLEHQGRFVYVIDNNLFRNLEVFSTQHIDAKDFVKSVLKEKKIKTPRGFLAGSFSQLKSGLKISGLDFPLVVKPDQANRGRGVAVNILTWSELRQAFKIAQTAGASAKVLVEEYFFGSDYRLLTLENKLIGCFKRICPQIIGDGKQTVRQLINQQFTQDRPVHLDWEVKKNLAKQKLTWQSIPSAGREIRLRENASVSTGGGVEIIPLNKIASRFKKIALDCAREFQVQFCGVDILASDISNPRADYRVIELNNNPGFSHSFEAPNISGGVPVTKLLLKTIFHLK